MNGLVHGRFLIIRHDLLVFGRGPLSRPNTTRQLPAFIIAPIADEWLVEGGFIAILGMLNSEKMPRRSNFLYGLNGDIFWLCPRNNRFKIPLNQL